jgi:hypothetical protein
MTTQPDPVPEGNPDQPLRGPHWAHESIENELDARREDPASRQEVVAEADDDAPGEASSADRPPR